MLFCWIFKSPDEPGNQQDEDSEMKNVFKVVLFAAAVALTGCAVDKDAALHNLPNSGVIPQDVVYDGSGHLVYDTEKLPYTGQWCHELDHNMRRIGSPSNCVANY